MYIYAILCKVYAKKARCVENEYLYAAHTNLRMLIIFKSLTNHECFYVIQKLIIGNTYISQDFPKSKLVNFTIQTN